MFRPIIPIVKFTNIPYQQAKEEGERQDEIMEKILSIDDIAEKWNSDEVEQEVLRRL